MNNVLMTRKDFIKNFHLTKTKTKCCFYDGRNLKTRSLYIDDKGKFFTIYDFDLYVVTPVKDNYVDGMERIICRLGSGYSWYH